jgi:hypothetical protein
MSEQRITDDDEAASGPFPAEPFVARRRAIHAEPTAAPTLSIAHLLLWTAACALFFSVVRTLAQAPPGGLGTVLVALDGLGVGAAWAGLCLFVTRRIRGVDWQIEPGEWLLALVGARLAAETLLRLTIANQLVSPRPVVDALTALLAVVPVFGRYLPACWKAVFYLLVALYGLPLAASCLDAWLELSLGAADEVIERAAAESSSLAALLVLPAVYCDWRVGCRRGWLHWVGLAVVWWLPLVYLVERALT